MKKKLCCIVFLCLFFSLFSFEFPTIQNTRNLGLGGNYIADLNSFYSFIYNPGNLGFQKKQFVPLTTNTQLGGNINEFPNLLKALTGNVDENFDINSLMNQDFKIHGTGPVGIGVSKKMFGWAVFNDTNFTFRLEDKTLVEDDEEVTAYFANFNLSESILGIVGFGIPLAIKNVGISIGANVKPFLATTTYADIRLDSLADFDFKSLPVGFSAGLCFDAGATVSFTEYVRFSLVWKDIFMLGYASPSETANQFFSLGNMFQMFKKENFYLGKINFDTIITGIGFSIPTKKITAGLVSKTSVYANFDNVIGLFVPSLKNKDQLLNFSAGVELLLLQTIALRCGYSDAHPSFGFGIQYKYLALDLAVFTDELGSEVGENSHKMVAGIL